MPEIIAQAQKRVACCKSYVDEWRGKEPRARARYDEALFDFGNGASETNAYGFAEEWRRFQALGAFAKEALAAAEHDLEQAKKDLPRRKATLAAAAEAERKAAEAEAAATHEAQEKTASAARLRAEAARLRTEVKEMNAPRHARPQ